MENLVPLGTGNSRFMKSNIPASTTLAQLIQMLNNGTFPYDIGPLNSAGISQQGTPLNKATLFSDTTAALYPGGTETPDAALAVLARFNSGLGNEYLWTRNIVSWEEELGEEYTNWHEIASSTQYNFTFTFYYADSITFDEYGNPSLVSPTEFIVTRDTQPNLTTVARGKYLQNEYGGIYKCESNFRCMSSTRDSGNTTYYTIEIRYASYVDSVKVLTADGYVNSPDEDAYPPSIPDGYEYAALGQLGAKTQIYTGSYTGTGTGTVTLTFPFNPGLVVVGFNPELNSNQYLLILTPAMSGLRANTLALGNNGSNDRMAAYSFMVEVISFSGNSVTFGRPEYPASVNPGILNDSGTNYWFIAIG